MSLTASHIAFRHSGRFALEDISFVADRGSWLGIIGANGSGKSTLLRIAAGLLPAQRGEVTLLGQPLNSYSTSRRAHALAYVPQSYQPAFEFTVEQTVLLGRMPYRASYGGFENDDDIAAAEDAMTLLELEKLRHEPVTQLSGGELQRVMIARALAQRTPVLLLDEPTAMLDIAHQQLVLGVLRAEMGRRNLTVLSSMHDLNLASMYCDSLLALRNGHAIASGTPEEVLTARTLEEVYSVRMLIEPNAFGSAPAVRYYFPHAGAGDAG